MMASTSATGSPVTANATASAFPLAVAAVAAAVKTATTMTPQQKVLYDKWSNYYNIRGYCSNKGTRYDLLQHQRNDKIEPNESTSCTRDDTIKTVVLETDSILQHMLSKSVSCIASTTDIPLESKSFTVDAWSNSTNDHSPSAGAATMQSVSDGTKDNNFKVSRSNPRMTGNACTGSATNKFIPQKNERSNCPNHPQPTVENEDDEVTTIGMDDVLAPEIMMMIHPYCVIPTTTVLEENKSGYKGNDSSDNHVDNLIQFSLMRHRLQATIDNNQRNNSSATPATANTFPELELPNQIPSKKELDAATTSATQDEVCSKSSSWKVTHRNSECGSIQSEISTNDLIQSVLEKHRLRIDATNYQENKSSHKKQKTMAKVDDDEMAKEYIELDDTTTTTTATFPVATKGRKNSYETTTNSDHKVIEIVDVDTEKTNFTIRRLGKRQSHPAATANNRRDVHHKRKRSQNSDCSSDDVGIVQRRIGKEAPRQKERCRTKPAKRSLSKRSTKDSCIISERTNDGRCGSLWTDCITLAMHEEQRLQNDLKNTDAPHNNAIQVVEEENDKMDKRNQQRKRSKTFDFDDISTNASVSAEDKKVAEAVLMLHRSKQGSSPVDIESCKQQPNDPSDKTTTTGSKLESTMHYPMNQEQLIRQLFFQSTVALPQQQQRIAYSIPVLASTGGLDPEVLQLITNNPFVPPYAPLTTATTIPAHFNNPALHNPELRGTMINHVVKVAPMGPPPQVINHGKGAVFHHFVSSHPTKQFGSSVSAQPQTRSQPKSATHLHPPANNSSRGIGATMQQRDHRSLHHKPTNASLSTSPKVGCNDDVTKIRPKEDAKSSSGRSTIYPDTDVGKLQQVNETWKKRYLDLLRDLEEE